METSLRKILIAGLRQPQMDCTRLLFWIFDCWFCLFDYSFWLFDYRVKQGKFVVAVETWFLPSEPILSPGTNFWAFPIIKCKCQIFEYSEQTTVLIIKYSFPLFTWFVQCWPTSAVNIFSGAKKMMTSVRALLKYFVVPVTENPRFLRHYLRNEGRVRKFCYCLTFENPWDFTNWVQSEIIAPSLLKLFWIGVVSKLSDILVIEELTNYIAFFSFRTFRYIDERETETKAQNLPWRKEFAVIT